MLRIRVLGRFEVEDDDVLLELGSPRRRALLALLALDAGRVIGLDTLVDQLWAASAPRTAAHVVHVYVSDLRRVLPPETLVTTPPGYQLRIPRAALDLHEFEEGVAAGRIALTDGDPSTARARLEAALSLWRGDVLEDLAREDFVQVEARRLDELRLRAHELWATAVLSSNTHSAGADPDVTAPNAQTDVVARLQHLAGEHPYREPLHALLMRALAAEGRWAEALDVFTAISGRLAGELRTSPRAELLAAHAAVLRHLALPTPGTAPARGLVLAAGPPPRLSALASTAALSAMATGRDLVVAAVLDAGTSPSQLTDAAAQAAVAQQATGLPGRSAAFRSRSAAIHLADLAADLDADLVVIDAQAGIGPRGRLAEPTLITLDKVTADVVLVPGPAPATERSWAVPFGGSNHDWAAAEIAALLARRTGGSLTVIGALRDDDDASRVLARLALALQRVIGITVVPRLVDPTPSAVAAATQGCHSVIGLSERWHSEGLGPFRHQLLTKLSASLLVRRGLRPGLLVQPSDVSHFTWSSAGDQRLTSAKAGR